MTPDAVNHFSSKSREYSYARPKYPEDSFKFLNEITPVKDTWLGIVRQETDRPP